MSLNFKAGSVRFGVGKEGVLRVTLKDETMETLGETARGKVEYKVSAAGLYIELQTRDPWWLGQDSWWGRLDC